MPAYETDHEQFELVKKWWADYGKWVAVAILIGLVVGFGWRYWQRQQLVHRQQASLLYEQLLAANSRNNYDAMTQIAGEMVKRYPQMEYASMANLLAAKAAVMQDHNEAGLQKLQWTLDHSGNASLKQIARLRAARLLLTLNKPGEAQKLLSVVEDKTYQPAINEVQGDIYLALGDHAKARQSYQAAQVGFSELVGQDVILSMQLAQP